MYDESIKINPTQFNSYNKKGSKYYYYYYYYIGDALVYIRKYEEAIELYDETI